MMSKSPIMHLICKLVWLLTALGCIHIGLNVMGYDLLGMVGLSNLTKTLEYVFGVAGAICIFANQTT